MWKELKLEAGGQLYFLYLGIFVIHPLNCYPLPSSLHDNNWYYFSLFWGAEIQVSVVRMAHLCSTQCLLELERPRGFTVLVWSLSWEGSHGWGWVEWIYLGQISGASFLTASYIPQLHTVLGPLPHHRVFLYLVEELSFLHGSSEFPGAQKQELPALLNA